MKQMNSPEISVIMAVYNTEVKFLEESINSILKQSFKDFEFIIVNDGSDKKTTEYLRNLSDTRIIVIENDSNIGLTKSLNRALEKCSGTFVARMDSDDIALPCRFLKQKEFMEQHKEYSVIGSKFKRSDRNEIYPKCWEDSTKLRKIRMLFYNDGICHPTAFFRRKFLVDNCIKYDEKVKKAQDYAMWLSIIDAGGAIGLCPEVLLIYRMHNGQITSNFSSQMLYEQMTIKKQLDRFDCEGTKEEYELFYHFYRGEITSSEKVLMNFLRRLVEINKHKKIYDPYLFKKEIRRIWQLAALKQIKKNRRFTMLNTLVSQLFVDNF